MNLMQLINTRGSDIDGDHVSTMTKLNMRVKCYFRPKNLNKKHAWQERIMMQ